MLWARQIASQRTGFAIPGPGPVQSDLFPVLEYAAPRAFYIGVDATLLENYDERTRQIQFAPAQKLAALKSLPRLEVLSLFASFSSVNEAFMASLYSKGEDGSGPCVFDANIPTAAITGSSESDATLSRAEAMFAKGDLKQAAQLADLSLQQNPTNSLAPYVSRVIGREQQLSGNGGNP
jgi:hypothetical protein